MKATHAHVAAVASRTLSSFRSHAFCASQSEYSPWRHFFNDGRVAFLAVERCTERGCPPLRGCDPWPVHPRRVVAYVLLMTALEFGDPVALVILVVSGDSSVHERIVTTVSTDGARILDVYAASIPIKLVAPPAPARARCLSHAPVA